MCKPDLKRELPGRDIRGGGRDRRFEKGDGEEVHVVPAVALAVEVLDVAEVFEPGPIVFLEKLAERGHSPGLRDRRYEAAALSRRRRTAMSQVQSSIRATLI